MNIILTGGTGLIGSALTIELAKLRHSLVLLSRSGKISESQRVQVVQWDAESQGPWAEHISKADAIINLAGASIGGGRWTQAQKERIVQSRVKATNALVQAIAGASKKPSVLVSASGVDYYGNVAEGEVRESDPQGRGFLADTTAAWEQAARGAERYGTRVVTARTGFVIASQAPAFRKMVLPYKLFVGGPYGSGKQWFSWVHIEDVVRGYIFALETSSIRGPMNLCSPNPLIVRDLARELGKALRRPAFLPAPAFGLKILLGEMSDLLLDGRRALPDKLMKNGFSFRFPTLQEALRNTLA